jgi:hypothetical protein
MPAPVLSYSSWSSMASALRCWAGRTGPGFCLMRREAGNRPSRQSVPGAGRHGLDLFCHGQRAPVEHGHGGLLMAGLTRIHRLRLTQCPVVEGRSLGPQARLFPIVAHDSLTEVDLGQRSRLFIRCCSHQDLLLDRAMFELGPLVPPATTSRHRNVDPAGRPVTLGGNTA